MAISAQTIAFAQTFLSNLKQAIRNRETVMIGGGSFEGDELLALRDALQNALSEKSVVTPVTAIMANLKHAVRSREKIDLGGGEFSGGELIAVLDVLKSQLSREEA